MVDLPANECCPCVRAYIERALNGSTYLVESVPGGEGGEEGLARIEIATPDLVLLDLVLPQRDGLEICHQIRQRSSTPIIVFTAAESTISLAEALKLGVHDFLSTPFNAEELRARVQRAVDRSGAGRSSQSRTLRVSTLAIDLQNQTITRHGQLVPLRRTDWSLLEFLVSHAGQISQAVRRCNLRRSRYIGLAKTRLQHIMMAVALNVVRVVAWLMEHPRAQTRTSRFAKLATGGT